MMMDSRAGELMELNRELRRNMVELHLQILHVPGSPFGQTRLYRELEQFHHIYARFLAKQEEGGYLDEVELLAPYRHEAVMQLHQEQDELLGEVDRIRDALPTPDPDRRDEIIDALRDLLERIEEHQIKKDEMVVDAFNIEPVAVD